jgi:hypothetical protein
VLYNKATQDSCVATVVNAVAYVNFANRCNAPHAEALGEECLGRGMVLLSRMIADKKQAVSDEALCSVYLMGVYEVQSPPTHFDSTTDTCIEHQLATTTRNLHCPLERCQCVSEHAFH